MKGSLPLVLLAVIALLIATAWLVASNREAEQARELEPLDAGAATHADAALASSHGEPGLDPAVAETSARAPIDATAALGAREWRGAIRGRVIVHPSVTPRGLTLELRGPLGTRNAGKSSGALTTSGVAAPSHPPIVLTDDGAFAWPALDPGDYRIEAAGADDAVWQPVARRVSVESGRIADVVWELIAACPAVLELQLCFDGEPTEGTVETSLAGGTDRPPVQPGAVEKRQLRSIGDASIEPPLTTDARGRTTLRMLGGTQDRRDERFEYALRVYASNIAADRARPMLPCFGVVERLVQIRDCERQTIAIDVPTTLVRVKSASRDARPLPTLDGTLLCSIGVLTRGEDGALRRPAHRLGSVELDVRAGLLGEFRAGPGTYDLECYASDGLWTTEVVVDDLRQPLDCWLQKR